MKGRKILGMTAVSISLILAFLLVGCPAPIVAGNEGGGGTSSDTTPPGEVSGLAATPGVQQVGLTWQDPGDSDFSKVQITWSPGGSSAIEVAKGVQSYLCGGLTGGSTYIFTVKTVDVAGNQSAGSTMTGTAAVLDVTPPSLTVTNLRNNGALASGFVVGTASDNVGVASVEVSLDGSAWQIATGTTSWKYMLPTGSSTWHLGTTHTISVRAKDTVPNISGVSNFTVKKAINKDVDGDGFPDFAISSYGFGSSAGRLWLYRGSVSGPSSSAAQTLDGAANDSMGYAVALGDFNNDGYADLAAGAPGFGSGRGRVLIFAGSPTGLSSSASKTFQGPATNSYYGDALACGDVNNDGFTDLAVGADGYNNYQGEVDICKGTASGLIGWTSIIGVSGASFGISLSLGDLNGDGCSDLAVGASTSSKGNVYVYPGSINGVSFATTLTGGASMDSFGRAVAIGDVNGDGYADLAIGATGYNVDTGRVYVYRGSITGVATTATTTLTGAATGNYYGVAVAIGDLNGDGYSDLVVTADSYNSYTGRVYVYNGSLGGPSSTASRTLDGETTSSFFGEMLAIDDMNLDGYSDLFVGAPIYSSHLGKGYLYAGSSAGVPSGACTTFTQPSSSYFAAGADF